MIAHKDERRHSRRTAAVALAAMIAMLGAGETRSEQSLTWERLSRMGAGIDFPHVRNAQAIRTKLKGAPRSYVIADGSSQTLYFYRATNCYRGEERSNAAWIDCGAGPGSAVYIPVLFVTPASKPRSGKSSPPADLVLRFGKTNSLENYVPEDPKSSHSSGNAKAVWIRLDNAVGGLKSSLAAPAAPAALVVCMPFASGECQTAGPLANLADDPGPAPPPAAPAITPPDPPPQVEPRPPVRLAAPAVAPLPRGPGLADPPIAPAAPAVTPPDPHPPEVEPRAPARVAAPPVAPLPRGPGQANPPANPPAPPAAGLTPGRWLLGLYGPQNIGTGVDASAGAIADAQGQILVSLTRFLDDFHVRDFKSPAVDLILMTSSDASPALAEKNVIAGTSRRPRSDRFHIDHEGNRRLAAFLSGPGRAGAEALFKTVGDTIKRYGQAAGESSGERPPIAVYVGAARAHPDSCPEWRKMTADVAASFSSRPRVLGIVFASAGAAQIDQQLGRNERGDNEVIAAARTRLATCNGEGGSALLFVSFPDLISQTAENMLTQVFDAVRRRAEKLQN